VKSWHTTVPLPHKIRAAIPKIRERSFILWFNAFRFEVYSTAVGGLSTQQEMQKRAFTRSGRRDNRNPSLRVEFEIRLF